MRDGQQAMADKLSISSRCRAYQLQLCKSRREPPHAALTESKSDGVMRGADRHFTCQTCGATLINSNDLAKPGWRHHR